MSFVLLISGYGPADLGYLIKSNQMGRVLSVVGAATNQTLDLKMQKVKAARHLYTYAGLLDQIEKWFRDPFGPRGGYLRCKTVDRKLVLEAALSTFG